MWVGQACGYACLAPEALLKLVVFCQMCGQHLERDHPVGDGVVGTEHLSHSAPPQQTLQFVMPE